MKLQLNGEIVEYNGTPSLADFLEQFAPERRVATLVNNQLVPAEARAAHQLQPDDRIEILTFAAGG